MGGAQTYALDICRYYKEQGLNVYAFTRGALAIDNLFLNEGIKVVNAPLRGFPDFTSSLILSRLLHRLPAGRIIIHAHRYRDAAVALLARRFSKRRDIRIITTRHAVRRGRDSWLFRWIYAGVDSHIFVSQAALARFRNALSGKVIPVPENKTVIIHNSLFITPTRQLPEPAGGPVTALYFGRIAPRKGLETIIDAFSLLKKKKIRLIIAGTGNPDFLDSIRRRAIYRGVMDMIDWKFRDTDTEQLMARSHFGVVPPVESEAGGLANLRFMAFGRPQITTAIGAPAEYLTDNESALFVNPSNPSALAEAIERLALNPDLRISMGQNALEIYDNRLSWDIFTEKLENIYFSPHSSVS